MKTLYNYQLNYQNPKIVFVSGGPGSGKGTQCERLVRDYHFNHISVGDIVRSEVKNETPEGLRFKDLTARGELVPDDLLINLIIRTIKSRQSYKFLIDGFPRGIEQAKLFEKKYKEIDYILNVQVSDEILRQRLLGRAETSGRPDDNYEAIANRIETFHRSTAPVLDFYNHFGKVQTVDGNLSVDEVFKQVQNAIHPNIIFMFGAPCVAKSEVCERLSNKIKYHYICLEKFSRQHNVKDEIDKVNKLIYYIENAPFSNFIVDSFFADRPSAEIFLNHFGNPFRVFYLESPKDEVMNNIQKYIETDIERKEKKAKYELFIKNRQGVLSLIEKQSFFVHLNAVDTIPNLIRNVMISIKPLVIAAFMYNNMDLGAEYCYALEKKRDFIFLDVYEQIQSEIERGTTLGQKMNSFEQIGQEIPSKYVVEMLQKILFSNINLRKFVLTNFPERSAQFDNFERELFPIDYLVNFTQQNHKLKFYHEMNPILDYYVQGKYINIDREALDIIDLYVTERAHFGFVSGPTGSGITTSSKYIAEKFGFVLVEWESTFEMLKTKLGGDEGPLEEVNFQQVENYFVERLKGNKDKTLFDGWPSVYNLQQLQSFLKKVGLPTFFIDLNMEKSNYIKRYRLKNQMDIEAELQEEEIQKMDEILLNASSFTNFYEQTAEQNFGCTYYKLDANDSLESTRRHLNNIFQKRVYVLNNYTDPKDQERSENQKLMFVNFCARQNIMFVDIQKILKLHYWQKPFEFHQHTQSEYSMRWTQQPPQFPSNYTPKLIMQAVQAHLKTFKISSRDILLYGYPAGDTPQERKDNERFYPRASDEIMNIEKALGPIRMVCVLTDEKVLYDIQDEAWELEAPKPKVVKREEGEENEDAPPAEEPPGEDEDENKPKFNIYDFKWTKCDGIPKTVPQWYNKLKKTHKKHYSLKINGIENTYDKLLDFSNLISEESQQNKAEQDYRKVNLFVQLRYDDVYEDEEDEQEPYREPYKHIVPEEPKLQLPDHDILEEEQKQPQEEGEGEGEDYEE
ncbi:hypothetical protein IMG5_170620 [Ichthyophthirius multifiliis]|uniref:Adenylate kinase n=1 Tax=Ichthyophthirius multifiliis TaxID=5932 RepID=G0R1H7_ICHMU|nr:hypothetical protein IMG5_170620 [Ichthyophthirius multifiliis]EGR28678.1 hypothetical protein IMG5_170620 [Ichthyophthirius multifiliis]|eukprot:XP_004029914.1 hypothetical protein IMG5_170620 [Ichthyophthirius multifiliis]